jgi:predicted glycogen debranching enzyme
MAGYPWFYQGWGRDTFISLPGILISTGRYEEAREVFRLYAKYQSEDGIIPNRIHLDGKAEYNTADGSLWFVESLYKYYKATEDTTFVREMLPVVNKILQRYTSKDKTKDIYIDEDGLVVSPAQ